MKESFADAASTTDPTTCHNGMQIADLTGKIQGCLNSNEKTNNLSMTDAFKIKTDIDTLNSSINDSLTLGDTIFTNAPPTDILNEVQARNTDLTKKVELLTKKISHSQNIIDTNNRDFVDHEGKTNQMPVLFVEDYTVFVFVMSYLFLTCIAVYTYTYQTGGQGLGKAIGGAIIVTIIGGMLFYSVA